jgi:hypothetical protein
MLILKGFVIVIGSIGDCHATKRALVASQKHWDSSMTLILIRNYGIFAAEQKRFF